MFESTWVSYVLNIFVLEPDSLRYVSTALLVYIYTICPQASWLRLSLTWNVRGVGDKIERTAALAFLKAQKADIIALVETHVKGHLQAALEGGFHTDCKIPPPLN